MKIKIAHLYYDLMNLYGEQGNVLALQNAFKDQKVKVEVTLLSAKDFIDFDAYDIFYIGTGSTENFLIALEDMKKYTKEIKEAIENQKFFIATGNSCELFGKFVEIDNKKHTTLGIFDYHALANPQRIVGECFMQYKGLKPIIGFQNRACCLVNYENHLWELISGHAAYAGSKYEGFHKKNFYGTYLIGPLLIRNPHFTNYLVKKILKKNYKKVAPKYETKAYDEYLKNFYEKT